MTETSYIHLARDGAPGAPLVFAFHGTGGDEHQFPGLVADLVPGAATRSPRGDVDEAGANRFFRRTAEGVYDMDDVARAAGKMAGFLAAHRARHPGRAVIGLGYSNGANILAATAFERPELFDRLVLMHPLIPWTPAPQPGLAGRPVLITGGRADPICPLPATEALAAWFRAQGAAVDVALHPGGHEVRQEEIARIAAALAPAAA